MSLLGRGPLARPEWIGGSPERWPASSVPFWSAEKQSKSMESSSNTNTSSGDKEEEKAKAKDSSELSFKEGNRVLAYQGPHLYEAKVRSFPFPF